MFVVVEIEYQEVESVQKVGLINRGGERQMGERRRETAEQRHGER